MALQVGHVVIFSAVIVTPLREVMSMDANSSRRGNSVQLLGGVASLEMTKRQISVLETELSSALSVCHMNYTFVIPTR